MTGWRMSIAAAAFLTAGFCLISTSAEASAASQARIAHQIEADVAAIIAGINAHDVAAATQFDAPDIVVMESGRSPSTGLDDERQGLGMAFQYNPAWRIRLAEESVDVSASGDMAVYRGSYNEDSTRNGTPYTHVVNFLEGFRKDPDGHWKVHWSVVCAQSPSHPANAQ